MSGLQMWMRAPQTVPQQMLTPPKVTAEELWGMQEVAVCHSLRWTRKQDLTPDSWSPTQPVHPKGNQSWIFIGRTDAETETPILWPPDAKNWLKWKDPDARKDWRKEEKRMIENEMVGWHHQLKGHEFKEALGVGDGQGSLVCCSPWG